MTKHSMQARPTTSWRLYLTAQVSKTYTSCCRKHTYWIEKDSEGVDSWSGAARLCRSTAHTALWWWRWRLAGPAVDGRRRFLRLLARFLRPRSFRDSIPPHARPTSHAFINASTACCRVTMEMMSCSMDSSGAVAMEAIRLKNHNI